jgi:hypothetical protein
MVTIVGYKNYKRESGEVFYALEVQGGIESVKVRILEELLPHEQLMYRAL